MKILLLKTLLLVTPFALGLAFIEYQLRQLPNSYSTTRAALEQRLGGIEVLFTGMSHTQSGVRTDVLDCDAFNLAYGSQSLYYDTQLVLKYAPAMPRLKLAVFTISYSSLEYKLNNGIERWRAGFYQQVYELPGEDAREGVQLRNYSYIALYTPKEAYRRVWGHFRGTGEHSAAPAAGAAVPQAGAAVPQEGEVSEAFGRARARLHGSQMHQIDIPANRAALEDACRQLQQRGVTVVFLTVPTHHTYYDYIDRAAYQRMQDNVRQLSANCQAEYFNYMFDARFTPADFLNSDHLNSIGAAKFSRIINEDFIKRHVAGGAARSTLDFSRRKPGSSPR